MSLRAGFLVGPTGAGKTELAHALALRRGACLLSADSMAVYRGMDVATAKPSAQQRGECTYAGIDCCEPDEPFSVSQYCDHVRARVHAEPWLVCGGTGLYLKALSEGLQSQSLPDIQRRAVYESILREKGVQELREILRNRCPERLQGLSDPNNPRRLIRALEQVDAGVSMDRNWGRGRGCVMAGLTLPRERLMERIRVRAQAMFVGGLLEEMERLLARYGALSQSAAQAIGYREAAEVLSGGLSVEAAIDRTVIRTRQLVKRQMTWFRNQIHVEWVEWTGVESLDVLGDQVEAIWEKHGLGLLRI